MLVQSEGKLARNWTEEVRENYGQVLAKKKAVPLLDVRYGRAVGD